MNKYLIMKRIIIGLLVAIGVVITYFYFSQISVILLALLIALIFEPFVRFFMRKFKWKKRIFPVLITFLSFIIITVLLIYVTVVFIFDIIYNWAFQIPRYAVEIQYYLEENIENFYAFLQEVPMADVITQELEALSSNFMQAALSITTSIVSGTGSIVQSAVAAIPNLIFVSLFFLIALFLFSLELPKVKRIFWSIFKPDMTNKLQVISKRMGEVFLGFWKAQFILSIGVFIFSYISLLFIAPGPALIMSVIIWIVDIIPLYVGPALVLVPWAIIMLILGDILLGIQLLVLMTVLLVLRRIIEPKVLGDSIGLNALPTVLSMYFGYVFGGIVGLILGPFVYIAILTAVDAGLFDLAKKKGKEAVEES